jgi:hypothetical protein
VDKASANNPREPQAIAHPDGVHVAFGKNGCRNTTDHEEFRASSPMVLTSHQHKRTAHENQCQACKRVYGSIPVCCIASDDFEVE